MIYCFDIDGTLCTQSPDGRYEEAIPIHTVIEKVNYLYYHGAIVKLYTARGSATHLDWREFTEKQLSEWSVKYHELHFGKPYADAYIDDRMLSIRSFLRKFEPEVVACTPEDEQRLRTGKPCADCSE